MNVETVIKYFKDGIITEAVCDFDCGGDSMGSTEWSIQGTFPDSEANAIENILDEMMYQNVDFYVNSDGHYQGESGTVTVEYDDNSDDELGYLSFHKDARSEYYEVEEKQINIEFTDEEKQFIEDNISDVGGENDHIQIIYKRDFVLTPAMSVIQDNIQKKILEGVKDVYEGLEEYDDEQGFGLLNETVEFQYNELTFEVRYGITVYSDDDY